MDVMLRLGLPSRFVTEIGSTAGYTKPLFDDERSSVEHAIGERQSEFAAGRTLARRCLERLNLPVESLPSDADRVPIWPDGLTGSITHAGGVCLVAVGPRTQARSIGIDLEPAVPLDRPSESVVCRDAELGGPEAFSTQHPELLSKAIFCAKEAVFKCLFPLTRVWLEFDDVEVHFRDGSGAFNARLARHVGPDPVDRVLNGCVVLDAGWIASCVALPGADDAGRVA